MVDALDHHEYTQCDDDKVEGGLDEVAIVDGGWLELLYAQVHGGQRHLEVGEVYAAYKPTYWRHNDIIDERRYDFAECAADDNTDSHIYGISLDGKLLEFVDKFTHNVALIINNVYDNT